MFEKRNISKEEAIKRACKDNDLEFIPKNKIGVENMKIDEMTDIEKLRELAKTCRVKVLKDCKANDGSDFIFKAGEWYMVDQDEDGVTLYSEDENDATTHVSYEDCNFILNNN